VTYQSFGPEHGEPLAEWQQHHRWMQFLAQLRRECLKVRPQLGQTVSWQGDEVLVRFPKIGTGSTETWRHRGQLRQRPQDNKGRPLLRPGDLLGAARWFLGLAIDEWLRELAGWQQPIAARMLCSEGGRVRFVFAPSSLLGAMVCQLSAALHGAWPFQECAYCHKFFRLQPGVNRANRLTCSHTCKQYLHNGRVRRAQELHAEGWTVRQIAKELRVKPRGAKSNVEIVKTWIERN
jgi:hypothetical protein